MSYADRMQTVSTEAELDQLMTDLRENGSPNWVLGAVRARVDDDLWPVLDRHFDESGRILPAGVVVEKVAASPPADPTPREPFIVLRWVRALHERLRMLRREVPGAPDGSTGGQPGPEVLDEQQEEPSEPEEVNSDASPLYHGADDGDSRLADSDETSDSPEPDADIRRSLSPTFRQCHICQERRREFVKWRGKELCKRCYGQLKPQ